MPPSIQELESALIKADKAGDVQGARQLAAAIRSLQNPRNLDYERLKMEKEYNPTNDMGALSRAAAGAGKSIADTGLGIKQLTGLASQEEVDAQKQLNAPLDYTPGGKVGNMVGSAAQALLPAAGLGGAGLMLRAPAVAEIGGAMLRAPTTLPGLLATGAQGAGMGFIQPTATGESRLTNTALGGAAGATIPALGMLGKGSKALVEPTYQGGRDLILGRALNDAVGQGKSAAVANMKNGGILVPGSEPTAAELANSGGIAAMQRAAAAVDPEAYAARGQAQNQARVAALDSIIGPPGRLETAIKDRSDATKGLRDQALKNANYGTTKTNELTGLLGEKQNAVVSALQDKGRFQAMEAEQTVLGSGPRLTSRVNSNTERAAEARAAAADAAKVETQRKAERDFVGRQLESLKQAGYSPLSSKSITDSLTSVLNKPGNKASDVVQKTVGDVREKLVSLADKNGNLKAEDLYTVRKELGDTISKYAKENQNWDKRFTAGLTKDIQSGIDDAITKAGGGDLWKQYLTKYQEMSRPVNKIEIVKELKDKSVRPLDGILMPNQYARALSDETAQLATGFDKATLVNSLDPSTLKLLQSVKADLARSESAKNLGRGPGSDTVQKLAATNLMQRAGLPTGLMNLPGVGRFGSFAYKEADEVLKKELSEALLDPKKAALLMEKATPGQKQVLLGNILRMGGGPLTLGAALSLSDASK